MEKSRNILDKVTRKWWFFLILILSQMVIYPVVTKNFSFPAIGDIIRYTLGHAFQVEMRSYYVYFQIIAIMMLFSLFVFKNRVARIFNIYAMISYIIFAFLQNVAFTDKYGLSIVTINVVMFLFVAYVWLREVLSPQNDYSFSNIKWKDSWMILLALIAFWLPLNNKGFDFNPVHFLDSGSSLAFCMMTPVFLTIMSLNIPHINIVTYRVTAIIGFVIGLYNMSAFQNPVTLSVGVIHLPLLIISFYAMIRSYKI